MFDAIGQLIGHAACRGPHRRCVGAVGRSLLTVAEMQGADSSDGWRVWRPVLRWYRRPTVRVLRIRAQREMEPLRRGDDADNEASRLPETESVHLGGLVLMEAFTPSTVSALYRTLESWPVQRRERRDELVDMLTRSRRGSSGGWQQLSVGRRPNAALAGDADHDPDLPEGVESVWLHLAYPMPSLAVVVATFTLSEQAADLSGLLRADYQTQFQDVRVRVYGRGARWRVKIPWSRPARHGRSGVMSSPEMEKHHACLEVIHRHEQACSRWFANRFPGRFSLITPAERPVMRLMLTTEQVPFSGRERWLRPVGLDRGLEVWRSSEPSFPGWALSFGQEPGRRRRPVVTIAARRADAAKGDAQDHHETNWALTCAFGSYQASLAVTYAMRFLLSVYTDRLGELRDHAGTKRRLHRPVRQARDLDRYLIGDGLDAVTIAADIREVTSDLPRFRRHVPDYTEDLSGYPEASRAQRTPDELVPELCTALGEQATRLADDINTATGNIHASAELRQAITNTRLQRATIILSIIATVIALLSFL